jgi:hypothetical protein
MLTGQAKTDYQREYMRRRRRAKLAQSAGLLRSRLPADERAEPLEQDQELIERLAQVTHERDQLRQELDRGVRPREIGAGNPCRCHMCHRGLGEVRMVDLSRRYAQVFICYECVDELHQWVHRPAS